MSVKGLILLSEILLCACAAVSCYSYSAVSVNIREPVDYSASAESSGPGKTVSVKGKHFYRYSLEKKYASVRFPSPSEKINNAGVNAALAGKYGEAEILFLEAISESPGIPSPYNNLGLMYEVSGKPELAFDMYSRACTIDPRNEVFIFNLRTFSGKTKSRP